MRTPAFWRLNALNLANANLQRLHALELGTAMVEGRQPDEQRMAGLRAWLDFTGRTLHESLQAGDVAPDAAEEICQLGQWLRHEIRAYYALDVSGPPRTQAAFGAAHVFFAQHQTQGEIAIADALGEAGEADRLRQFLPRLRSLEAQAKAAVGSSAEGEPPPDVQGFIAEHVRVALADRERMLLQVDGIAAMCRGQDPAEA